jgi:hypothetical protein
MKPQQQQQAEHDQDQLRLQQQRAEQQQQAAPGAKSVCVKWLEWMVLAITQPMQRVSDRELKIDLINLQF